jgi:aquaporin Z
MNKYLTEAIGTFVLVLVIGCTVTVGPATLAPLAIGSALMVMVYAGGHVSGAHYNPAVTIAIWIRGRCATADVGPYIAAQIAGALGAAAVVKFLRPEVAIEPHSLNVARALVAEGLFTFILAYVVLNVATAKANAGNSFYGLAIGFTVLAGALAVGDISAAFNPAVAIGITVLGLSGWPSLWIYVVACFGGAALAALVFKAINPQDN